MNNVTLIGNLTADPKLTNIADGVYVVNFCLAHNALIKRANGETKDEVTFVNCEAWDSGAERIAQSFKKGDRMMVVGSLKNETWEKDGIKHRRDKVRVRHFERVVLGHKLED